MDISIKNSTVDTTYQLDGTTVSHLEKLFLRYSRFLVEDE